MSQSPIFAISFKVLIFVLCFKIRIRNRAHAESTSFDFETLMLKNLKLLGDAHLNNGTVSLSKDIGVPNSGSGRALYSKPIRFRQQGTRSVASFSTFFSFSVSNLNPSSIGGGLAFLIAAGDQGAGEAGAALGLVSESALSSVGFVAVEFDTLMDVEFNDINGNHVGLDLGSLISVEVCDLGEIGVDLKSGNLVNCWIDYDSASALFNVSVSYSNFRPIDPLFSHHLDLSQFVNDIMFVGFSASTQGSTEVHTIDWWSFTSTFSSVSSASSPPNNAAAASFFTPIGNSTSPSPPNPTTSTTTTNNNTTVSNEAPETETTTKTSNCHNQLCKQGTGAVVGVATAGAFVLAIFGVLLIWVFSKRFKRFKSIEKIESLLPSQVIKTPKEFTYKDLKLATNGFHPSRAIGHGAFGTVYKGIVPDSGAVIAVKKCSHSGGQGKAEFLSELSIIGSLRHRNLVQLQGWCHEKGEILLVYDLMSNGSLDKALFESPIPLQWHCRMRILTGVASALAYLHHECETQVIHRDVKASNIMLDDKLNARLGDFGLARQIEHDKSPDATVTAGTMGYLAPEYLLSGRASEKTDVFSYGAVALEVATGRRPIERSRSISIDNANLVEWVWRLHREGKLMSGGDMRLGGEFDEGEMMRVLLIGLVCSHPDPLQRPSMRGVVQMLGGDAEVPIVPTTKPSMSFISTSQLLLNLQDTTDSDSNAFINVPPTSDDDDSYSDINSFTAVAQL
ncbi:hypothetical protein Syun_016077 [Stephania yunnanensis]|uniref:non-specific serine/threonine protein kinase n=1 Tax=Stephania yunnanensis TaxID=152371 RepID=A0AAP0J590_9MAGN